MFKIERTLEKQRVAQTTAAEQDVIGLARQGAAVDLQMLFVRGGLLIGRKDFFWPDAAGAADEELIRSAIEQFYNKDGLPPKELLAPMPLTEAALLETWLSDKKGEAMKIVAPERGAKHQLLLLAEENAASALADHLRDDETERRAIEELKRLLRLERPPRRIEGFDISNTMGDQPVASLVVWEEGQAKKADYRRFRIRTVLGANDFASMQEAVRRRYGEACGERLDRAQRRQGRTKERLPLPDLILIDGGLGQLAAAKDGLAQAGRSDLPVVAMAKERGEKGERVFLPGRKNPITLHATSPATHLLQRVRDEAHRFAISYHRKLRGKTMQASQLDQIIGVGEIRRNRLLRKFGGIEQIAAATEEELRQVGIDEKTAAEIRKALAGTDRKP
jgi:excinuclease ABC subunit C